MRAPEFQFRDEFARDSPLQRRVRELPISPALARRRRLARPKQVMDPAAHHGPMHRAARPFQAATHKRIGFRIGITVGDVIVEPEDIFGDGVNIAARCCLIVPKALGLATENGPLS